MTTTPLAGASQTARLEAFLNSVENFVGDLYTLRDTLPDLEKDKREQAHEARHEAARAAQLAESILPSPLDDIYGTGDTDDMLNATAEAHRTRHYLNLADAYNKEATEASIRRVALTEAYAALDGALLQLAKQALGFAYGGGPWQHRGPQVAAHVAYTDKNGNPKSHTPLHLSDWIRVARNQAGHWETPSMINSETEKCFDAVNPNWLPDVRTKSLATEVIEHLHWTDISAMRRALLQCV